MPLSVGDPGPHAVAPPGFCNGGEVRYGSIGGLEYEVPQSRLYCLCINVALCSTALQCICRVIRTSSMTMKTHTYYIIFGRPPIGGKLPPSPLAAPLVPRNTWFLVPTRGSTSRVTQCRRECKSAASKQTEYRDHKSCRKISAKIHKITAAS